MVGYLGCRVCKKQFSATISGNYFNIELSAPVDVYCEWIDACENVNKWLFITTIYTFSTQIWLQVNILFQKYSVTLNFSKLYNW